MDYNQYQSWLGSLAHCRNLLGRAGEAFSDGLHSQADDLLSQSIENIGNLRAAISGPEAACSECDKKEVSEH